MGGGECPGLTAAEAGTPLMRSWGLTLASRQSTGSSNGRVTGRQRGSSPLCPEHRQKVRGESSASLTERAVGTRTLSKGKIVMASEVLYNSMKVCVGGGSAGEQGRDKGRWTDCKYLEPDSFYILE